MTDRYIRAAGLLRGGRFGQPFPALPARLLSTPKGFGLELGYWAEKDTQLLEITAGRTGLEVEG